jgi:hypothetical protein
MHRNALRPISQSFRFLLIHLHRYNHHLPAAIDGARGASNDLRFQSNKNRMIVDLLLTFKKEIP